MDKRRPEVLAPAGDMERLQMAVAYGADAVYLAGQMYGMRSFAGNFSAEELETAVALCHAHSVRVHVTCNTMPRNDELAGLPEYLSFLQGLGIDALIVGDVGVLALAKRYAPKVSVHISTQTSVTNYAAAQFWHDQGAERIILARELTLNEVAEICARRPRGLEVEAFVHGAMCVSYSGRCVISNYMTGRDASRGACAQPCRYQYALMEEQRPGEFFPVEEDERGTYLFNSKDMCMIDHIPELLNVGLDSLKIEGRAKSAYYAAVVTNAYRRAVDAALAGEALDPIWRGELDKVSHRPYSQGFWYGHPEQYVGDARYVRDWQVSAMVTSCAPDGKALCSLRNKFHRGETLELVGPGLAPVSFTATELEDKDGLPMEEARAPQMPFLLRLPCQAPPLSIIRKKVAE